MQTRYILLGVGLLTIFSAGAAHATDPGERRSESPLWVLVEPYLQAGDLEIFNLAEGDIDGDGEADLALHVARSEHGERAPASALIIASTRAQRIVVDLADGMLCPYCPVGEVVPEQSLIIQNERLTICESWGTDWFASTCQELRLTDRGRLEVVAHTERSGWAQGPATRQVGYDFSALTGTRSYINYPEERGFPVLTSSTDYALTLANAANGPFVLDGKDGDWEGLEEQTFGPNGDTGGQRDLGLTVASAWTEEGIWLYLEVTDDTLIEAECDPRSTLAHVDHLELWFDTGESLHRSDAARNESYADDLVRHQVDQDVMMFELAPGPRGACLAQSVPWRDAVAFDEANPSSFLHQMRRWLGFTWESEKHAEMAGVSAAVVKVADGYVAEVFVDAGLLGSGRIEPGGTIGFTALVHDVDPDQQVHELTRLATSEFSWGDPFTMGLMVFAAESWRSPTFPFVFENWMR